MKHYYLLLSLASTFLFGQTISTTYGANTFTTTNPPLTPDPSNYGFNPFASSLFNLDDNNPNFYRTGSVNYLENGVQITSSSTSQYGSFFIDGIHFSHSVGLSVEFEYEMKGGSQFENAYGDGISFFLYNGNVNIRELTSPGGTPGSGLGYAYSTANNTNLFKEGIIDAYLGIGLDAFGNFKNNIWGSNERRNGIFAGFGPYRETGVNHITLRGARRPTPLSVGNNTFDVGYAGYPVLITRSTIFNPNDIAYSVGKILNSNRDYTDIETNILSTFELRNNGGYRKAELYLMPNEISGFDVKVDIQINESTKPINVINYFHYPSSVPYTENAIPNGNLSSSTRTEIAETLDATVPNVIKVGFSGSTGAATQEQIIKNLFVSLPYSANSNTFDIEACNNNDVKMNILSNDWAFSGPISINPEPKSSFNYIDLEYFTFEPRNRSNSDKNIYHEVVTPEGTFNYTFNQVKTVNSTTGTISNGAENPSNNVGSFVTFTPNPNVFNQTGSKLASINYTIKGFNKEVDGVIVEPYGDAAYRSFPSLISVALKNDCQSDLISNRMVTQDIK